VKSEPIPADNPLRVTSEFWVGALLRRAQAGGAFVAVAHKGAAEAGAIFVVTNNLSGTLALLGPAPQIAYDDAGDTSRQFEWLLKNASEREINEKISRERKFDPDIWVIEIEDREGRCFVDQIIEDEDSNP